MSEAPDPEVVELATKIFDLARQGRTEALVAYLDAGVPADLTNDRGDSLVMLAAYHGHADNVLGRSTGTGSATGTGTGPATVPVSTGIPRGAVQDLLVLTYGDPAAQIGRAHV